MSSSVNYLALDIGEKRIGVATSDDIVRIAVPYDTIAMNEETFRDDIAHLITQTNATHLIVGYPRNQSGEPTAQTQYVEDRSSELQDLDVELVFQDESLTSVIAEQRLVASRKTYEKADIDKEAAAIILQDYLESRP